MFESIMVLKTFSSIKFTFQSLKLEYHARRESCVNKIVLTVYIMVSQDTFPHRQTLEVIKYALGFH